MDKRFSLAAMVNGTNCLSVQEGLTCCQEKRGQLAIKARQSKLTNYLVSEQYVAGHNIPNMGELSIIIKGSYQLSGQKGCSNQYKRNGVKGAQCLSE